VYGNETEVGQGIQRSNITREKIWITTKVWMAEYGRVKESCEESLQKLQTDYIDLLLLHRPTSLEEHEQALDSLMKLQEQGKIRQFGVSNFTLAQLQHAWEYTNGKLFTQQIEYHLALRQEAMKQFADSHHFVLTAYSPLGHGHLLKEARLLPLAEKHQASVAQICIAWLLHQGAIVIPKASTEARLAENFAAQQLKLDEKDLQMIATLPNNHRYFNPPFAPQWDD
jgi:2,5-diketo-D-gluconate reductase B